MGIPNWSSVNGGYRLMRGYGNAQAIGFNQAASATIFGTTSDQEGMGQAVYGPPTILKGEEFGAGVATVQIKAMRSRSQDAYQGAYPFANSRKQDALSALANKLAGSSKSANDPTKFGALSREFGPGDKEANRTAPSDPTRFGSVGYAVTGNGSVVDLSV